MDRGGVRGGIFLFFAESSARGGGAFVLPRRGCGAVAASAAEGEEALYYGEARIFPEIFRFFAAKRLTNAGERDILLLNI